MTTTPTGPAKPDPTQPILVGAARPVVPASAAQYAPPSVPPVRAGGASVPSRRRPIGLIAAVVVLAVALMGLGAYAVLRPYLGGTSHPATTPSTQPASTGAVPPADGPVFVPFDLAQGLPAPLDVVNSLSLGVWDGVGVFAVWSSVSTPSAEAVRAVDVRTGSVLWTLDELPDGRGTFVVTGAAGSNGTLALSVAEPVYLDPAWPERCSYPAYILLLSLREGTLTATQPVAMQCAGSRTDMTYSEPVVTGYADGVVVVDTHSWGSQEAYSIPATTGYADTNLTTPVWRVEGTTVFLGYRPTPVLSGHWIMAASDTVVDIRTGQPSSLQGNPYHGPLGVTVPGTMDVFTAVGDNVVWSTGWNDNEGGNSSFTMWSSPASTQPEWSYNVPAGRGYVQPVCFSDDIMIVVRGNREATDEGVDVVALDRADGHTLWSATYPLSAGIWTTPPVACTIVGYEGDKEMVVVSPYEGPDVQVYLLDAVSGRSVGGTLHWSNPDNSNTDVVALYPCGTDLVCANAVSSGSIGSNLLPISVAGLAPVALPPHPWSGWGTFDDPVAGTVGVGVPDGGGKGEFVLM